MLLQLLELAGNRALEFDPDTSQRLKRLEGRSLCLHITTLSQSVSLTPQAGGLELSSQIPDQVDVTLKASISALMKLGRDGLDEVELEPGELEIIGDPLIGQRFAQLIAQLNIDWEAMLAEQLGPSPAKALSMAANSAVSLAREGREHLHDFVIRGLHDNTDLFADQDIAADIKNEVELLAERVNQLEDRLKALLNRG